MPTRRSTAEAFQILISHAFGDAGSPYLVGVISEAIKNGLRVAAVAAVTTVRSISNVDNLEIMSQVAENATTIIAPTITSLAHEDTIETQFKALQYSLFSTCFVEVLGGVFFLLTAAYILKDRANVDRAVAGNGKFDW